MLFLLIVSFTFTSKANSQQYGYRSFSIAPKGLNVAAFFWEHQGLNLDPTGSILFKDADVKIDALSLSYSHYFSLMGKTAQINVALPYVFIDAATGTIFQNPPLQGLVLEANPNGLADPYVHFSMALHGGESVEADNFKDYESGFVVHSLVAIRVPLGTYDETLALNTGQNRFEFRLGVPLTQQWGKPGKQTTLEFTPVVAFFTNNNKPFGSDKMEQKSLFHLEAHATHDIIKGLLTLGADINYIFGGEVTLDNIAQDNKQEYWTAGIHASGRFSKKIGWGAIIARPFSATDNLKAANWFRFSLNYSF